MIGALAAGGKGALIGGPVGTGAGTAVAVMTERNNIHLSAETPLTFRFAEPKGLRDRPKQFSQTKGGRGNLSRKGLQETALQLVLQTNSA